MKEEMVKQYVDMSKTLSYALRHKPEEFGVVIDGDGFTDVQKLIDGINAKAKTKMKLEHIEYIIANSDKKRFELSPDKTRIRATYGHSIESRVSHDVRTPPKYLFHGTTHKALQNILEHGLLPMNRQYVHLSQDVETAKKVGGRRESNPVILRIDTKKVGCAGLKFYYGNDTTWLCDRVPPSCIEILER